MTDSKPTISISNYVVGLLYTALII